MNSTAARRVLALLLLALPAAAQNHKLNGPLWREFGFGGFDGPQTSSDGEYLVYSVFSTDRFGHGGARELHSLPTSGEQDPIRLTEAGGPADYVQITLKGTSILYLGDRDANGSRDLVVEPIDGSKPPVVLNPPLDANRNVSWFYESRDGLHVLYVADQDADERFELFSVLLAGSAAPVKINGQLAPGGDVQWLSLSNDGRLAVYSADQDTDDVAELFVVPVDGSQPARKLSVPLVPGGDVYAYSIQFDSDAFRVLYLADQEENERYELFSVATDGSQPPRKLNGPLVPGGDVGARYGYFYPYFTLSPDGRSIVYSADQDTDDRLELYGVPVDGSRAAVKLSAESDRDVFLSILSYDSAWAVYQSDPSGTDAYELFSVPIDGSAPARRISGPMAPGGSVSMNPQVSFDSLVVVYRADQDADEVHELYSAPIDGSAPPVKLNAPLAPGGDVGLGPYSPGFWVMKDGVLYQADQEQGDFFELYFAPIAGGVAPRKLASGPVGSVSPSLSHVQSPPADFGQVLFSRADEVLLVGVDPGAQPRVRAVLEPVVVGDVYDFDLVPAGERAVYLAREEGDEDPHSYTVPTSEGQERLPFHPELIITPRTSRLVPDGSRLVFLARPGPNGTLGVYSARADGTGTAAELSVSLGAFSVSYLGDETFGITADGRNVLFFALAGGETGLFSAPVDGRSQAIHLSAALPSRAEVARGLKISADGSRVAFRSPSPSSGHLYTAPIDGSAPARLVSTNVLEDFQIDARGERVVFRNYGGKNELFVAPTDGSAPPLRLNAPMPPPRDVTAFALAPDGTRVVYLADQAVDQTFELFSARIEGSLPPVRLHPALAAGQDVESDFQISSDSRRVVYRADVLVDWQAELFSVPIDASRPPVQLNGTLVSGGRVQDYRISPDGKRVVYMADQQTYGVVELFSTPIQGSLGRVKLSRPLVPGGDVWSFQISADSRTVAFTAARDAAPPPWQPGPPGGNPWPRLTLLAAPIGEAKAVELAGPFQGGGSVQDYRISADGAVVAYLADQDELGVVELFAARRTFVPPATKR